MNKRGQILGIAAFVLIVFLLILVAPIILKVATSVLNPIAVKFSQIDTTNKSADVVTYTQNKITGTFDWIVMVLIIVNILVLLVSAFLVDINPAFVVIYIIGAFTLVITAPYTMVAAEKVYSMNTFNDASTGVIKYLPMSEFVLNNFGVIIVGVIVLTGIIMFAKITRFNSQNAGGGY
jgi:hypothetical protein